MTEYVTVEGVEVLSAGMAWRGGAEYYVTTDHLAAMVAAQHDPLIRRPRVKLGHWSQLFGPLAGTHDASVDALDSEPAFGSLENLRLNDGGTVLIADLVEVPAWLAAGMASAYPTRSAEWMWDWTTQGQNTYAAVLTDLALGGVWRPAVEDLQDITPEQAAAALAAFMADGPDAAAAALTTTKEPAVARSPAPGTASLSVDRVQRAFYEAKIAGLGQWLWLRDVRLDPDEIIVTDEDSDTDYRIPFSTDGEDAVTFAEPVEVRGTYVDVASPTAAASAAGARSAQRVLATDLPRPEREDSTTNPAASRPDTEENHMDPKVLKALAAAHGLDPDTATEEQVNAAVIAAADTTTQVTEQAPADTGDATEVTADADGTVRPADTAPEVTAPETVPVSKEVWEETQTRLATLENLETERVATAAAARRDAKADRWVASGRIAPAEKPLARGNLDIDEDKTTALYEAMPERRVPVGPSAAAPASASTTTSEDDRLLAASRARMGHKEA